MDRGLVISTYLQNIDTLPRNVAVYLVLVVEMPSERLGGLIHRMLDLHSDTSTSLRLFDDLRTDNEDELDGTQGRQTHILILVVDL